ncbi:MAG: hypothetical protein PUH24_00825 [Prevotellaceae bacterium]|nr:hypothetical protein [Prevotella sp.]MDD7256825.1 hypothetical protein [Prevotellaceae bacterium]MDY6131155.1 hypothetical protein [Prevotella sp.]
MTVPIQWAAKPLGDKRKTNHLKPKTSTILAAPRWQPMPPTIFFAKRAQQPHGSDKGKAAVAAVSGQAFIAHIRPHQSGQAFRIGEDMQA